MEGGVEGGAHLVGSVTDADVEIWDIHFDEISNENIKLLLFRPVIHERLLAFVPAFTRGKRQHPLSLDSFRELCRHPRIKLHCGAVFALLENSHREISCSWSNFQHDIRRFKIRLVHDSLSDSGIEHEGSAGLRRRSRFRKAKTHKGLLRICCPNRAVLKKEGARLKSGGREEKNSANCLVSSESPGRGRVATRQQDNDPLLTRRCDFQCSWLLPPLDPCPSLLTELEREFARVVLK